MSDVTTELVIGAQTSAARSLADSVPALESSLRGLGEQVTSQTAGFAGNVANSFYQALGAWAKAGSAIPGAILGYAARLVVVDRTVATSQTQQSATYRRIVTRLEGFE